MHLRVLVAFIGLFLMAPATASSEPRAFEPQSQPPAQTPQPQTTPPQTPTALSKDKSSKWWQSPSIKAELALTAQQSAAVEEIFQGSLPKLRASKEELDRLETILSDMVSAGADEAQVIQHLDRVEAARSEMSKARTLMLLRMRRLLSPEQRVKLTALHDRWNRDRSRDGHRVP